MKRFKLTKEQILRLRSCVAFASCKETLPFYNYTIIWEKEHEELWKALDGFISHMNKNNLDVIEIQIYTKDVEEMLYCIKVFKTFKATELRHPADGRTLKFDKTYDLSEIIGILENTHEYMTDKEYDRLESEANFERWQREEEIYARAWWHNGPD